MTYFSELKISKRLIFWAYCKLWNCIQFSEIWIPRMNTLWVHYRKPGQLLRLKTRRTLYCLYKYIWYLIFRFNILNLNTKFWIIPILNFNAILHLIVNTNLLNQIANFKWRFLNLPNLKADFLKSWDNFFWIRITIHSYDWICIYLSNVFVQISLNNDHWTSLVCLPRIVFA